MKPVTDYEKIKDLLFNCDKNLFITGPGGTGKTYLINSYLATATDASDFCNSSTSMWSRLKEDRSIPYQTIDQSRCCDH